MQLVIGVLAILTLIYSRVTPVAITIPAGSYSTKHSADNQHRHSGIAMTRTWWSVSNKKQQQEVAKKIEEVPLISTGS